MYCHLVVDRSADLQDVVAIIAMYLTIVIISLMKQPIVGGEIIGLEIHRTIQCRTKRVLYTTIFIYYSCFIQGCCRQGSNPAFYTTLSYFHTFIQNNFLYIQSTFKICLHIVHNNLPQQFWFVCRRNYLSWTPVRCQTTVLCQTKASNHLHCWPSEYGEFSPFSAEKIDNSYVYSSKTAQIWDGRNRQYEFNMQRYGKKIASQDVQNFYSHLREEHSSTNPPFLLVIGSISHKGTSVCLLSPPSCIVYQRTKDELL